RRTPRLRLKYGATVPAANLPHPGRDVGGADRARRRRVAGIGAHPAADGRGARILGAGRGFGSDAARERGYAPPDAARTRPAASASGPGLGLGQPRAPRRDVPALL